MRILSGISVIIFILFTSCEEIGPTVNMGKTATDTTYVASTVESPQQKVVLLEDFSGVRCVNCPDAHEKAKEIDSLNPGKVILLTIHGGIDVFTQPYGESDYDFRTQEGTNIESMVGKPDGYPACLADRVFFSGEESRTFRVSKWSGYASDRLQLTPPVNIYLEKELDESLRSVKIKATLHFTSTVSEATRLSIAFAESSIVDPQLTETGVVNTYVHDHVFRGMVTPYNGISTNDITEAGRVIIKEFTFEPIPDEWDLNHIKIIGFVHLEGPDTLNVLQAATIPLK